MHPVVYNSKAALTARKVLDKLGSFYLIVNNFMMPTA